MCKPALFGELRYFLSSMKTRRLTQSRMNYLRFVNVRSSFLLLCTQVARVCVSRVSSSISSIDREQRRSESGGCALSKIFGFQLFSLIYHVNATCVPALPPPPPSKKNPGAIFTLAIKYYSRKQIRHGTALPNEQVNIPIPSQWLNNPYMQSWSFLGRLRK